MSSVSPKEQNPKNLEKVPKVVKPLFTTYLSVHPIKVTSPKVEPKIKEKKNFKKNEKFEFEIKCGMNNLNKTKSTDGENSSETNEEVIENKNFLSQQDFNNFRDSNNFFGYENPTNLLEPMPIIYPLLNPYFIQQQFRNHFYLNLNNYFPYGNLYPKTLYISDTFSLNYINKEGQKINTNSKIKENIGIKKINKKNIPQKIIEDINLIKLYFNIPENFLNEFKLKDIKVEQRQLNEDSSNQFINKEISFKDMEIYINNLCKNILNKDFDQNENDLGKEYIKYENISKDDKNLNFLQHKRNPSRGLSEENNKTEAEFGYKKSHPLKKNCKKKIKKITRKLYKLNNSKNGKKICVNLNQIQTLKNKFYLKNFPFHYLLNTKEVKKITFLKGLLERKDVIRLNRKEKLLKEYNNTKNLNNKKFELIYINENCKYIVYITGINILYIISYYYYQIHKSVKQINEYHYAHGAFYKFLEEIKKIELFIKNCNKIVDDI